MHSSSFENLLKQISTSFLPKNIKESKFENYLKNILKEQDIESLQTAQPTTPTTPPPVVPTEEVPELPNLDDLASMEIIKLTVAALFVELSTEIEKNPLIRKLSESLNDLKPISPDNADEALSKIENVLDIVGIPTNFSLEKLKNIDFATKNVLVNLAVNALFVSKDQLQNSDPSIGLIISKIADKYSNLKDLESKDPSQSFKLAKELKTEIEKIVNAMDFSVET